MPPPGIIDAYQPGPRGPRNQTKLAMEVYTVERSENRTRQEAIFRESVRNRLAEFIGMEVRNTIDEKMSGVIIATFSTSDNTPCYLVEYDEDKMWYSDGTTLELISDDPTVQDRFRTLHLAHSILAMILEYNFDLTDNVEFRERLKDHPFRKSPQSGSVPQRSRLDTRGTRGG